MSGDEVGVLILSGLVSVVCWGAWYVAPTLVRGVVRGSFGRPLLQIAPLVAAAVLWEVLRNASSYDVRDDPTYLTFYLVLGAAWVGLWIRTLAFVGISVRDDVVERANGSAAIVAAGAMLGITLCYAGGNIGDGPGWWVVVFSAGLATISLFAAWMLVEMVSGVSEVVTIDRDTSAGVRLAAFLIACGLILGRGVAGDWVSADATVQDFLATAWPAAVIVVVAAVVERLARPTPTMPRPQVVVYGIGPALVYLVGAAYYVARLGLPS